MKTNIQLSFLFFGLVFLFPICSYADTNWTVNGSNIYNANAGNVGVGTTTPASIFEVSSSTATIGVTQYSSDANAPVLNFRKARGSGSSPSFVTAGDIVGQIDFSGMLTNGSFGAGARILARAAASGNGSWSGSGRSSELVFYTTPTNSSTLTERLKIGEDGKFTFNSSMTIDADGTIHPVGDMLLPSSNRFGYNFGNKPIGYTPTDGSVLSGYVDHIANMRIDIDSDNDQSDAKFIVGHNQRITPTGGELFVVQDDGNVGVGTTTPTAKLHVDGNIKLTGGLTSDGDICIGYCQ